MWIPGSAPHRACAARAESPCAPRTLDDAEREAGGAPARSIVHSRDATPAASFPTASCLLPAASRAPASTPVQARSPRSASAEPRDARSSESEAPLRRRSIPPSPRTRPAQPSVDAPTDSITPITHSPRTVSRRGRPTSTPSPDRLPGSPAPLVIGRRRTQRRRRAEFAIHLNLRAQRTANRRPDGKRGTLPRHCARAQARGPARHPVGFPVCSPAFQTGPITPPTASPEARARAPALPRFTLLLLKAHAMAITHCSFFPVPPHLPLS